MSNSTSRSIDLNELINRSDLIVSAQKQDSSLFTEDIFIIANRKSPPFTSRYYLFNVSDIIYNKQEIKDFSKILKVYCADDSLYLKMYENFVKEGSQETKLTDSYESEISFDMSNDLVLFLKREKQPQRYSFTVNGAFESCQNIKGIKDAISSLYGSQDTSQSLPTNITDDKM